MVLNKEKCRNSDARIKQVVYKTSPEERIVRREMVDCREYEVTRSILKVLRNTMNLGYSLPSMKEPQKENLVIPRKYRDFLESIRRLERRRYPWHYCWTKRDESCRQHSW